MGEKCYSCDYYELLGLEPGFTLDDLRSAHKRAISMFHPDRNKSAYATRLSQWVNEAYDVLSTAVGRADFHAAWRNGNAGARRYPFCVQVCWEKAGNGQPASEARSTSTASDQRASGAPRSSAGGTRGGTGTAGQAAGSGAGSSSSAGAAGSRSASGSASQQTADQAAQQPWSASWSSTTAGRTTQQASAAGSQAASQSAPSSNYYSPLRENREHPKGCVERVLAVLIVGPLVILVGGVLEMIGVQLVRDTGLWGLLVIAFGFGVIVQGVKLFRDGIVGFTTSG